jgi:hypothetical protein
MDGAAAGGNVLIEHAVSEHVVQKMLRCAGTGSEEVNVSSSCMIHAGTQSEAFCTATA